MPRRKLVTLAETVPGKAIKETIGVRAYYMSEVQREISLLAKDYPTSTYLKPLTPDLDELHKPVIDAYLRKFGPLFKGIEGYRWQYPTAGSSEAIFHILAGIKSKHPDAVIYTLKGEYEGYREYSKPLGLRTMEVIKVSDAKTPGYWFISNPSARDGNLLGEELIGDICDAGHKIVYDATYVGCVPRFVVDLSNQNIVAILASMSKPFGMFYYRVGFAFTREEMGSLFGNKWFKNIFSLLAAQRIIEKFGPDKLVPKYKKLQREVVEELKRKTGLPIVASDVFLIATINKKAATREQLEQVQMWKRGDEYRICLTPYFMSMEK
ncbi:MAG: aminotransferase class I/II-fold pyridoxal phosphate-dependent enzyme [Candidatus Micrarchaeales archaeon]|jgi:histidinol-phosphate/aromatic aminotransferase/cobyric acid decarboxylase-like protein